MVCWSALGRSFGINIVKYNLKLPNTIKNVSFSTSTVLKSGHGHETMAMQPSRFQYIKFKDMLNFYIYVGMIPVAAIIFYANVFIGPATLTPTPEGYNPKHWEYHRHPITRFLAKYVHNNPQQDYEKFMHFVDEEKQKMKMRALDKEIMKKMSERQDYKAYYYRPVLNKYLRINKQTGDELYNRLGDDYKD